MKKISLIAAVAVLAFLAVPHAHAQGQNFPGGKAGGGCITTVANLTANCGSTAGTLASVTDGSTTSDCTVGGGTNKNACIYSGTVWGFAGNSGSNPTFAQVGSGTNTTQTHTVGSGGTLNTASGAVIDFSGVGTGTFKIPSGAGFVSSATKMIGFDSTAGQTHVWNGADSLFPQTAGAVSHKFVTAYNQATGAFTQAQPASTDLSDSGAVPNGFLGASQGQLTAAGASTLTGTFAFFDGGQFALGTNQDVCVQAQSAETAWIGSHKSAFMIVIPVNWKAYCSVVPWIAGAQGDLWFIGKGSAAIIYTSVSWANLPNGLRIHGAGPAGTATSSTVIGTELKACNPLLHDNSWPGNASNSAPCAAFFNSTTNMPQQTVSSITAASSGTATITLSGALSGTPPSLFAGRELCLSRDSSANAADQACFEIHSEPAGNVFTVNSTSMQTCAASCGTAFLDTPLVQLGAAAAPSFFSAIDNITLDCSDVYACDGLVNAGGEEGSAVTNVQLFNATNFGIRNYVGNSSGAVANSYGVFQGAHSGPFSRVFFNYIAETCEIFTAGCPGTDGTHTTAGFSEPAGTSMACGNNTVLSGGQAIIAYSSATTNSTCQKNFVGLVSDGIGAAVSSNSYVQYGFYGVTISEKDVFNTGTHVRMPELSSGLCMYLNGPTVELNGFHTEYCVIGAEILGNATFNETWIADGTTVAQGVSLINGDMNNASQWNIDVGGANGTTNVVNLSAQNISTTTAGASHQLQNTIVGNENCTNSSEKNIWYVFVQTATAATIVSDCSTAANLFAQKVITPASTTSSASLNIPQGTAPSSPANGDVWVTTAGIFVQVAGVTVGPLGPGGVSGMTALGIPIAATASTITSSTNPGTNQGTYLLVRPNTTQGTAVTPTEQQIGDCASPTTITGSNTTGTVAYTDVMGCTIVHDIAASAGATLTIPTPTTLNNAHPIFWYRNDSASSDTLSPTTFTISLGNAAAASTLTVPANTGCRVQLDPVNASTWKAFCHPNATAFPMTGGLMTFTQLSANTPASTQFVPISGATTAFAATEANIQLPMAFGGHITGISARVSAAEGAAATLTLTIRKCTPVSGVCTGTAQSFSCVVPNNGLTCSDTTPAHAFAFLAGDFLSIQTSQGGTGTSQVLDFTVSYTIP